MRCAWISAGGATASVDSTDSGSGRAVIWRLLGDRHVVHVALAHAGAGDAHERWPRAHLLEVVAAVGVTPGGSQSARKLIQDRNQAALEAHAALDNFHPQFLQLGGSVLKI